MPEENCCVRVPKLVEAENEIGSQIQEKT